MIHHKIKKYAKHRAVQVAVVLLIAIPTLFSTFSYLQNLDSKAEIEQAKTDREKLNNQLLLTNKSYQELKNQDQLKINEKLKADIDRINKNYKGSIDAYQKIQDLKSQKQKTDDMESLYVNVVKSLAELNYASAEPQLADLNVQIKKSSDELAAAQAAAAAKAAAAGIPAGPATASNTPPGSGYSFQSVKAEIGTYSVSIVAADLDPPGS